MPNVLELLVLTVCGVIPIGENELPRPEIKLLPCLCFRRLAVVYVLCGWMQACPLCSLSALGTAKGNIDFVGTESGNVY
jgi:hypothetical protein